jgi:hypothetical protein
VSAPTRPRSRETPDFIGAWPRLKGRQEPEFESRHPGDEIEGDRCAQFGANIGLRSMPWQWSMERGILSLQDPNEYGERIWTHRDDAIEATRQQGKTYAIVRLILFHLYVEPVPGRPKARKIIYTAQRWSTASDVFERVRDVIDANPFLKAQLAARPTRRDNHGLIMLNDGSRVEFAPRTQDFGRGLTELDIVFIDEAYDIVPAHIKNLRGAQSASLNPQTIFISTPPVFNEHPNCHMLGDLHRLGHAHAPDLFYQLYAAPRHLERDNPEAWRLAQPSYGIATNETENRTTYEMDRRSARRRALFDADYLGWGSYPPPELDGNSEIPPEKWTEMGMTARRARGEGTPKLVGRPAIVLERTGGPWTIEAAWRTSAGTVQIEVGYCEVAGDTVVVDRVVALRDAWDPVAVMVRSGSAAAELIAKLEKAGVEVISANRTEVAQACGGFLNAALGGELSHSDQSILTDGTSTATKKELPAGGFIWELIESTSYAQLMGASLAHYALIKYGELPKRKTVAPRSGATRTRRKSRGFDPMSAAL